MYALYRKIKHYLFFIIYIDKNLYHVLEKVVNKCIFILGNTTSSFRNNLYLFIVSSIINNKLCYCLKISNYCSYFFQIPNHLVWLCLFYLSFHSFLNLMGEMLHFADRKFYCDWWNANNIDTFWRTWNMPVHRWAVR